MPTPLSAYLPQGESSTQEFKLSTGQRTQAAKTLCAMLNHKGGRVIFRVDPKGKPVGQAVTDKTLADVSHELSLIQPPALPSIDRVPVAPGREAIVVSVPQGQRRPYTYKGRAYRWENQPAEGWTPADLDLPKVVHPRGPGERHPRAPRPLACRPMISHIRCSPQAVGKGATPS